MTDAAPTLGEISIYLYGTTRYRHRIAKWNKLRSPYTLRRGQTLKLETKPKLTPKQGAHELLAMWRKRFGLSGKVTAKATVAKPIAKEVVAQYVDQLILPELRGENPAPTASTSPLDPPEAAPTVTEQHFDALAETARRITEHKAPPVAEIPPEYQAIDPERLFKEGESFFREGKHELALERFRECIRAKDDMIAARFYEMRTLSLLGRKAELRHAVNATIEKNPMLASTPVIQKYTQEAME